MQYKYSINSKFLFLIHIFSDIEPESVVGQIDTAALTKAEALAPFI